MCSLLGKPLIDFKPSRSVAELLAEENARKREAALEEMHRLGERNIALSFAALKRFMVDGVQARLEGGLRGLATVQRQQDEDYAARVASEDAIALQWQGRLRRTMAALQKKLASDAQALFERSAEAEAQRRWLQLELEDAHRAYREQNDAAVEAQRKRAFLRRARGLFCFAPLCNAPRPCAPPLSAFPPAPQCSPSTSRKRAPSTSS